MEKTVHKEGSWYYAMIDGKNFYFKMEKSDEKVTQVWHLMAVGLDPNGLRSMELSTMYGLSEPMVLNLSTCSIVTPLEEQTAKAIEEMLEKNYNPSQIAIANEQNLKALENAKKSGKFFVVGQ